MNSCLYRCDVRHKRLSPKQHTFKYRVFMFLLDIDEVDDICSENPLISRNSTGLYEFRDSDHYQEEGKNLRESIESYLYEQGIEKPIGKIRIVTNLRFFGHVFNPVSFYFIESTDGNPLGAIAEVGNTFKEQKLFFLSVGTFDRGAYRSNQKKNFYVSPFSDLDTLFRFALKEPGEKLAISINEQQHGAIYFQSLLSGQRELLTKTSLTGETIRFPFLTLKVVLGIHWQALRLFLKGVRHRKKSDHPELQTGIRTRFTDADHPAR